MPESNKYFDVIFDVPPIRNEDCYAFQIRPPAPPILRRVVNVNKKTHRIRFENETEDSVAIVIEPKDES